MEIEKAYIKGTHAVPTHWAEEISFDMKFIRPLIIP